MEWRIESDAPIYSQLKTQIILGIISGEYASGERLPSVRDMAVEAGVNPNTMQRALTELEREELIFSQRTAGRFVTEDKAMIDKAKCSLADETIRSFLDAMSRLGYLRDEILSLLAIRIKEENGNANL